MQIQQYDMRDAARTGRDVKPVRYADTRTGRMLAKARGVGEVWRGGLLRAFLVETAGGLRWLEVSQAGPFMEWRIETQPIGHYHAGHECIAVHFTAGAYAGRAVLFDTLADACEWTDVWAGVEQRVRRMPMHERLQLSPE